MSPRGLAGLDSEGVPASCSIARVQDPDRILRAAAPDVVAAYDLLDPERLEDLRLDLRQRAGPGTAPAILAQLDALALAMIELVSGLSDRVLAEPGGESDWDVAATVGHVAAARSGLVLAASLAARGRFPSDASAVVPGVPGPAGLDRAALVARLESSRRFVARAGRAIAGHETDPCPLDHPIVGRLRCGEWLIFAGVHDLTHVDQLRAIVAHVPVLL